MIEGAKSMGLCIASIFSACLHESQMREAAIEMEAFRQRHNMPDPKKEAVRYVPTPFNVIEDTGSFDWFLST